MCLEAGAFEGLMQEGILFGTES